MVKILEKKNKPKKTKNIDKKVTKIILKGDLPSPANLPSGCKFHTRCPFVMEKCKTHVPEVIGVEHKVKCFLYD